MKNSTHPSAIASGLLGRIYSSILSYKLRIKTDSDHKRFLLRNLFLHFRPTTVPERTLRFSLTFGLGGMAVVMVLLQLGSGILLKFVYEPTPFAAYASVQELIHDVPFGRLIRNIHYWGANLLVITGLLHMLRVFFTGAFHSPRQLNWIIGLAMFGTILLTNLTGYLLPWDQLAFWAITVSTGMLDYIPLVGYPVKKMICGGGDIGSDTLHIFYAIHTAVMPAILIMLMAFHFWRVRKAGGLVIPRIPEEAPVENPTRVPTVPNLILREVVVAIVLVAVVMVFSIFMNAPLGNPANPGMSPNPTKAPWYFAGLQELLMHFHPVFAVCIIPFLVILFLMDIPYLKYETNSSGIWFVSRRGRRACIAGTVTAIALTPLLIAMSEWITGSSERFSVMSSIIDRGIVPLVALLVGIAFFSWILNRKYSVKTNETIQAVFVLLLTAFIILTLTNIWFRGEGMALMPPW